MCFEQFLLCQLKIAKLLWGQNESALSTISQCLKGFQLV